MESPLRKYEYLGALSNEESSIETTFFPIVLRRAEMSKHVDTSCTSSSWPNCVVTRNTRIIHMGYQFQLTQLDCAP